jgi:hypothetical protein
MACWMASISVEDLDHRANRGLDAGLVGLMRAAAFGLTQVAQLVEPADQGGERLSLWGWRRPGRLIGDEGGETGEHSSIDRIGLRPSLAAASRESAGAIGMHPTKGQTELGRDLHQGALITASRFADHGAGALRPGSA